MKETNVYWEPAIVYYAKHLESAFPLESGITFQGRCYYLTLRMKMLEMFSTSHSLDKSQDIYADP